MAITGFCNSAKTELMQGAHVFLPSVTLSCSGVSGQFTLTGLSSTLGIASGMQASGAGLPVARPKVATVDSASQVTLSKANIGTVTTVTFAEFGGFSIALIKASPSLTYSATQTAYITAGSGSTPAINNLGSDEVAGTGYSAGGNILANNEVSLSGSVGIAGWTSNPSWTSSTFSTSAGMVYNSGSRLAGIQFRTIGVIDFSGTQAVMAGTLTLLMPAFTSSTAIIQVN